MRELAGLAVQAVLSHRLRSALSMLGIGIGIASVILLTSIGEGTRRHLMAQFTQFGTNLMQINPGKTKTLGIPGAFGGSTQKLTIDDALALRKLPGIEEVTPLAFGMARISAGNRGRSVIIYGVTPNVPAVWQWDVQLGSFWPEGDARRGAAVTVLGPRVQRELFGEQNPLGQWVRIAGSRLRVIGVMEPKGQMMGFDLDDSAYIPVATAMQLFNLDELNEIDLVYSHPNIAESVEDTVRSTLIRRHGREDFSVTSQAAMLDVFDNVLNVITMAVGAIAGISLVVGAIGILTMMWISVGERTQEIGLMRAIGASRKQILAVFLAEAAALSSIGGLFGVLAGFLICRSLRWILPGLPVETPIAFVLLAILISLLTGLLSGVLPARRAAALEPMAALRDE